MKLPDWLKYLVVSLLAIFAVLWFVKPRIVTRDVPFSIPDSLFVHFKPAKPDTIYYIKWKKLVETRVDTIVEMVPFYDDTSTTIQVAEKTFTEDRPEGSVTSMVRAYALAGTGVFEIENDISLKINKMWLADQIDPIVSQQKKNSLKNGLLIGAGSAVLLGAAVAILAN
jgi:hypothetical protein